MLDLARYLPNAPDEDRFAKYYDRNPHGQAALWLACESESGRVVGMAGLLTGHLQIDGQPVPVAVGADFAIEPEHRGLGPALTLQRSQLADLGERGLLFAYGCPNADSEPIVKRVGYRSVGELTRFVKVLRSRHFVDRLVPDRRLARSLGRALALIVHPLLQLRLRERRARRGQRLSVLMPPAFDERFARVWASLAQQHRITGDRTVELLNWRYDFDRDGASEYSIFAVADGTQVSGYLVYRTSNEIRHVFDLACLDSRPVIDTLLTEFLADARAERVVGISFRCLGPRTLLTERLRHFGFLARDEDTRLHVYRAPAGPSAIDVLDRGNWYFVMGDSDL
ncbi:MAG TPA: GNAT family N-acetyltransferase [Solirubrobacteraceae bacterium]|nr:GNAT family N-acetyltransferase [Solirubrobacteraceae bacterium]